MSHGEHWHEAERRNDAAELDRVRVLVAQLRRDGLSPGEIVAAISARRRMRDETHDPATIGQVLVHPPPARRVPPAGATLGDVSTYVLDVLRGDGDDL